MANQKLSKALGERFTFTLANASAGVLVVALLAAFFDTLALGITQDGTTKVVSAITHKYNDPSAIVAAGYNCDAVLDDGVIATGLTATAGNRKFSIRQFREYIKQQGRQLVDMVVTANNEAAFNEVIEVIKATPLQGSAAQYLHLSDFYSVDQTSNSKINLKEMNLDLDFDTLLFMPINPGHTVTITFIFS